MKVYPQTLFESCVFRHSLAKLVEVGHKNVYRVRDRNRKDNIRRRRTRKSAREYFCFVNQILQG